MYVFKFYEPNVCLSVGSTVCVSFCLSLRHFSDAAVCLSVQVSDFGLSRFLTENSSDPTYTSSLVSLMPKMLMSRLFANDCLLCLPIITMLHWNV